jgi:hypothetical protein
MLFGDGQKCLFSTHHLVERIRRIDQASGLKTWMSCAAHGHDEIECQSAG